MTPVRVFFLGNEILIDTITTALVAGSLTAALSNGVVTISRQQSTFALVSVPWILVADVDGNTFASPDDVMTYLSAQFAMRRPLGLAYPSEAELVWTITHSLGFFPNVIVIDTAGDPMIADPAYPDINTVILTFGQPTAGTAYLS